MGVCGGGGGVGDFPKQTWMMSVERIGNNSCHVYLQRAEREEEREGVQLQVWWTALWTSPSPWRLIWQVYEIHLLIWCRFPNSHFLKLNSSLPTHTRTHRHTHATVDCWWMWFRFRYHCCVILGLFLLSLRIWCDAAASYLTFWVVFFLHICLCSLLISIPPCYIWCQLCKTSEGADTTSGCDKLYFIDSFTSDDVKQCETDYSGEMNLWLEVRATSVHMQNYQ